MGFEDSGVVLIVHIQKFRHKGILLLEINQ